MPHTDFYRSAPIVLHSNVDYHTWRLVCDIIMGIIFYPVFPWYCYLLAYEKLEKKYKVESDIRFGNTYEFFSKFMVSFVPGIIITVMTITYLMDKVFLGLVISSAFIIPSLALYFRDGVFNDES